MNLFSAVPVLPSPTAAGLARRFTDDHLMGVGAGIAPLVGRYYRFPPAKRRVELTGRVTIDIDSTDVEVYGSRKQGMAVACQRDGTTLWPRAWDHLGARSSMPCDTLAAPVAAGPATPTANRSPTGTGSHFVESPRRTPAAPACGLGPDAPRGATSARHVWFVFDTGRQGQRQQVPILRSEHRPVTDPVGRQAQGGAEKPADDDARDREPHRDIHAQCMRGGKQFITADDGPNSLSPPVLPSRPATQPGAGNCGRS